MIPPGIVNQRLQQPLEQLNACLLISPSFCLLALLDYILLQVFFKVRACCKRSNSTPPSAFGQGCKKCCKDGPSLAPIQPTNVLLATIKLRPNWKKDGKGQHAFANTEARKALKALRSVPMPRTQIHPRHSRQGLWPATKQL